MLQNIPQQVRLFGPNVQLLKCFGIVPNINLKTNRLHGTIYSVIYSVLLIIVVGCMEIFIWVHKFYMDYSDDSYLPVIVRITCELTGFIMFNCVVTWSYTKRKLWEKLFQEITSVYNQQTVKEPQEKKRSVLRNANLYFVVITFLILLLYCMDIFFWQIEARSMNFILSYVYFYYNFLLSNVIGHVALEIGSQYKYMTNALVASEYTNRENGRKILNDTKRLYIEMNKVIGTFNNLFGPILLLMAVQCSLQILDFGVFLVEKVLPNLKFEYDAFLVYVIFIIMDLTWFSVTQFRCEMAKDESQRLLTVCYNLLDNYNDGSELLQETHNLIDQIKNRPVQFTAADFFEIKRSTTFSIIGSTATYFIVYVELRSNDSSWTQNNGTI
ncbi:hypothetical protein ABEB36_014598 [Hypothenemus hampei]|uniref:Gustatory receptor n=1 Tax=Hypothenemus hampei TaxID=57062 RepID=A0ABD1E2A2_HYPHA